MLNYGSLFVCKEIELICHLKTIEVNQAQTCVERGDFIENRGKKAGR